jgi:hypothetical protein
LRRPPKRQPWPPKRKPGEPAMARPGHGTRTPPGACGRTLGLQASWTGEAPETRPMRSDPMGTDPEPKIWAASPDENTPRGPNQAVRSIPGGHGTEGVPPSWSLHRVTASVWASGVQVRPSRVLHGRGPWALSGRRQGTHGRHRAGPCANSKPRPTLVESGVRGPAKQSGARRFFGINLLLSCEHMATA